MIGKTLGNCKILEELGRGGMAVVYRAYQASLNRYVAIKVLPPQLGLDRQFVERFQREARSAANLRHPNIVVIHDVGHEDGVYYIVMELLEGRTLRHLIEEEGALPEERAARIVEQVGAALDYAHRRGFVHRDVKPSNIFVGEEDRVTLTDFGIAKAASEAQQLTRTGMLMGTPEYMSPEQAEGEGVDHRTDLYALGVVLYRMLVGRVPFQGSTPHATLHNVIYEEPPPPRSLNPDLEPGVEAVILKAVAKRPGQRYQSGAELGKALEKAVAQRGRAVPIPPPPTVGTPRRGREKPVRRESERSPLVLWIMAAIAGVLVLILGALLLLILGDGGDGAPTLEATQISVGRTSTSTAVVVVATATSSGQTVVVTEEILTEIAPTEPAQISTNTPPPSDTLVPPTFTPIPPTNTPNPPTNTPRPPTNTPEPPTRTPTPTPACAFAPQGAFAGLWQTYRGRLGCPLTQSPQPIRDAEQAFDNGHMFWREDNDRVYVVYESGSGAGNYRVFEDIWSEGDPEYSCAASPPPGRVQPKRGFGAAWCLLGGESASIGWGLGEEAGFWPGYGDPLVQDFERGMIFRDSDGTTKGLAYVFFADSNSFVRVNY
jgi:serine/threonine-protein kinase